MAIQNKDFRVKHGIYVGQGNIDALRGDLSASNIYGKLLSLSATGVNGTGSDTALSGQETLVFEAVSGVNVTITNNNVKLGLNIDTDDFSIDSGTLKLNTTGTGDFGVVTVGGGYGSTGITLSETGNISANGELVVDGNTTIGGTLNVTGETTLAGGLSATTLSGDGSSLTTNFTISAGGDVDGVTTNITSLNGTYNLNLELTDTGVSAGTYGSSDLIPAITVDDDGRITSATTNTLASCFFTLNTQGDSGTGSVDLSTDYLSVIGTVDEIETSASGNVITIGLPDDVTITGDLRINGNDIKDSGGSAALTFDGSQNTTAQGNLTVVGDLLVSGSTTTQNVSTVLIEDPVIKLASNNIADTVDIGFYGQYRVGTCSSSADNRYTGIIRDNSLPNVSAAYVFFDGTTTDLLSANATGDNAKPSVSEYANVYLGRLGINTNDYNANNRLTVSGVVSTDTCAEFGDDILVDSTGGAGVTVGRGAGINTYNTALGFNTLASNTSGANNTGIGYYSLCCNTAGCNNTATGVYSLHRNTSGVNNTAIGSSSLCSLSGIDASGNTAIGMASLCSSTIGVRNTGVGVGALLNSTTGCNNVALGACAGDTLTTGCGNIIIGYNADVAATDSNSIVIGCGATGLGDNSIVIGNSSITKTYINSACVGIGMSNPARRLDVSGDIGATGNLVIQGNSTLGDSNADTLTINGATITVPNLPAGTSNNVLVYNGSNQLVYDAIDSKVWGTSLVDTGAGGGTINRLAKFCSADSIIDSSITDDGTTVTIGTSSNPTVFNSSSTSTSVYFGNCTTGYHSASAVAAAASSVAVLSFPLATWRSGKVIIQSFVDSQYEVAELLFIHDGTNTYQTEYGNITTGSGICVTYDACIVSSNVVICACNSHAICSSNIVGSVTQLISV